MKVKILSGNISSGIGRPTGKPTQNAYVERFNGTVRQELYNLHIFDRFSQVRQLIEDWQRDYNENRPHKGLKYKTPLQYAQSSLAA